MPKIFTAKITHATLTFSPFTSEGMFTIGSVVLDSAIIPRIASGRDITDASARPLSPRYLAEKTGQDGKGGRRVVGGGNRKYLGSDKRDWTLRGATLRSLKVKSASEMRVTLGPITEEAAKIITARNRLDHMWGLSPRDYEALYAIVRQTLISDKCVRVVRGQTRVA